MEEEIKVGNLIKGCVTGIEKYGFFVSCPKGYSGLVHISEISDGFIRDIHEFVQEQEEVMVEILEVDEKNKKLKLSVKNVDYRSENVSVPIDSAYGFEPLRRQLPQWTKDTLEKMGEEYE